MMKNKKDLAGYFDEPTMSLKSTPMSMGMEKHPESCSRFVSLLFKAKEDAHITHIEQRVKSLAIHEAMGTFYDTLDGLLDTFAETVMAVHGQLTISFSASVMQNPLQYMESLYSKIDEAKSMYTETWILNQIDEMHQLVAHTMYRLKYVTAAPAQ
jgi:hypothetical protein